MSQAAGSGAWCLELVDEERRGVLRRLRGATSAAAGFPDPNHIAREMSLRVQDVPSLPRGVERLTDARTIWVVSDADPRVRGTRLFRGIASAILWLDRAVQATAAVEALAGRLAAPPALMSRLGLAETVRQQRWATPDFLRWCWASRLP